MAFAKVIDELIVRLRAETDNRDFAKLENRIDKVRAKLDGYAGTALKFGTAAAAPLALITKSAISTDAALRQLEARTGASAEQLAAFKQQAYDVGSVLPLNTADIIKAQTAFIQLGNSIEETLDATPAIAMAAVAAEGVEVEDSARYASIALKAFKLEAEDATTVLDQMLVAETTTAARARDIGEAFRFSAQSAADAGLNTSTYIAILGGLAESGRSAEESSQGLNVLLTKMAGALSGIGRGGKLVNDALAAVGITSEEVQDALRSGPTGILRFFELLRDRSQGLDSEVLTGALRALVGESYASAFSSLVQNIDTVVASQDEIFTRLGEGERQAQIKMKGLSGAWETFKAQIDTVLNVMADIGVSGPMEKLLRWAASMAEKLTEVDEEGRLVRGGILKSITTMLTFGSSLLLVAVALKAASFLLGGFTVAMRAWVAVTTLATKHAVGTRVALMALAAQEKASALTRGLLTSATWRAIAATGAMKVGVLALNAVMLANPVGLTIAAIAAGALLLLALWKPVSTFFVGFWQGLTSRLGDVKEELGNLMDALGPVGTVLEFYLGAWKRVFGLIAGIIKRVFSLFGDQTEAGRSFASTLVDGILGGIRLITGAIEKVTGVVSKFLPGSDAEEGPLRHLTAKGEAIVDTLAEGINRATPLDVALRAGALDLPSDLATNLSGLTTPLPVGPSPTELGLAGNLAGAGAPGGPQSRTMEVTFAEGSIVINAEGGDPGRIAAELVQRTSEEMRALVEQSDSPFVA